MASSGSLNTGNYEGRYLKFSWSVQSTSVDNNSTTISWDLKGAGSAKASWYDTQNITVIINGNTVFSHKKDVNGQIQLYDGTVVTSNTYVVKHSEDGTGKLSVSVEAGIYVWEPNVNGSNSWDLPTIPRASSLSLSASTVNVGDSITANISRASSSFTHNVEFYINDAYYQEYTGVDTSQSYTIPTSWYDAMPSSTSCTAYCRITTYNGSTKIGDQVKKSFTVNVPSSIEPTIGTIELAPATINSKNILIKGKNKLTVSVSGCSAGSGSTIKSYSFSGPSVSTTISSTSDSASTAVSSVTDVNSFTNEEATLTYKVTVTDKRGRTASKTNTIKCYNYYSPSFSKFNAYRANSDGSANVNGTYIQCTYTEKYASVNSTNNVTVTAYYNDGNTTKTQTGTNGNILINLNGDTSTTYRVYLGIDDTYGGSNISSAVSIFGQFRVFNVTSDGTGFSIGKMAESSNLFECRWPAKFHSDITFAEGVQCTLKAEQDSSGLNIAYLMTGQNTSAGAEAGLAVHKTSVYVPSESNDGIVNLGASSRRWNQLYVANSTISTSDKNKKKDIHDMSDTQEQLFDQLRPVTYKMISGNSGRIHYGFIAQDVEDALTNLNLTGQDFAGFCKDARIDDNGKKVLDENGDIIYDYALRYSEFIALNTYMIQKLQTKISELEEEVRQLKESTQK